MSESEAGRLGRADSAPEAAAYPEEVRIVETDGRRFVLVGTAHVSQESVQLVREVIERERPDAVCIELDQRRFEALSQRKRWESLDLREVIKNRQLATLLLNVVLSSYQKRLGGKLGVVPGSELLEAANVAAEREIPVSLCDRDVRITLKRAWGALSFWKKAGLLSGALTTVFETPELNEEELRRLKKQDALNELMQELGRAMPELKRTLIDERDAYLATKIRATSGQVLVAVVGAGHLAGMAEALQAGRSADLGPLETLPEPSPALKLLGWSIAALVVGSLAYIGMTKGPEAAGRNALFWVLATGVPTAIGAVLALAHPVTVLSGFLAAPITSLSPVIGAGYVTAFVQAYVVPPRVLEFETVSDDIGKLSAWWNSRLLRVFLVFILTSIGGTIGTLMGGAELVRTLFG
jgi:pheromone shutdown-related protein TraB